MFSLPSPLGIGISGSGSGGGIWSGLNLCFSRSYAQFVQRVPGTLDLTPPLTPSSGHPSQVSLGQPKQGGQASLGEKGVFGQQGTLGRSHCRHQPPGSGHGFCAGSRVLALFPPHILRKEDFLQRHVGPFCLEGDLSPGLCSQGPFAEWMEL